MPACLTQQGGGIAAEATLGRSQGDEASIALVRRHCPKSVIFIKSEAAGRLNPVRVQTP